MLSWFDVFVALAAGGCVADGVPEDMLGLRLRFKAGALVESAATDMEAGIGLVDSIMPLCSAEVPQTAASAVLSWVMVSRKAMAAV